MVSMVRSRASGEWASEFDMLAGVFGWIGGSLRRV
jgi:hypothetical protein